MLSSCMCRGNDHALAGGRNRGWRPGAALQDLVDSRQLHTMSCNLPYLHCTAATPLACPHHLSSGVIDFPLLFPTSIVCHLEMPGLSLIYNCGPFLPCILAPSVSVFKTDIFNYPSKPSDRQVPGVSRMWIRGNMLLVFAKRNSVGGMYGRICLSSGVD
jgi:hypothetical protein